MKHSFWEYNIVSGKCWMVLKIFFLTWTRFDLSPSSNPTRISCCYFPHERILDAKLELQNKNKQRGLWQMNIKVTSSGESFLLKDNLFSSNRMNILDKRSKIMLVLLIYHYMSNFLFPSFRFYYHKINWCRNRWSM